MLRKPYHFFTITFFSQQIESPRSAQNLQEWLFHDSLLWKKSGRMQNLNNKNQYYHQPQLQR